MQDFKAVPQNVSFLGKNCHIKAVEGKKLKEY
jgi:hypothetical protein